MWLWEEEGEGGRLAGTLDLGTSLDDDPLFLPAIRSLTPFLGFKAISSSSSLKLSTTLATTRTGVRTPEILSNSSFGSDMWMT